MMDDLSSNPWGIAGDRASADIGEFDWGPGLVPHTLEDASPAEGGMYKAKSPACVEQISVSFDSRG